MSKKALGTIGLYMEHGQRTHIESCGTGREAWVKLTSMYDNRDEVSKLAHEIELNSMKMRTDENVSHWISRVESQVAKCNACGMGITESRAVNVILYGLTDTFNVKRKMILHDASKPGVVLTIIGVSAQLIAEESTEDFIGKHSAMYTKANTTGVYNSQKNGGNTTQGKSCKSCNKKGCKCNYCQKVGHHEKDCFRKRDGKPKIGKDGKERSDKINKVRSDAALSKPDKSDDKSGKITNLMARMAKVGVSSFDWLLDSGCSDHIIRERSVFESITPKHIAIMTGDARNQSFYTEGVGHCPCKDYYKWTMYYFTTS